MWSLCSKKEKATDDFENYIDLDNLENNTDLDNPDVDDDGRAGGNG